MIFLRYVLLFSIYLLSSSCNAGWVISEVSSDQFGNKSYQTTFLQNNVVRYESDLSVAIIDLNNEQITLIFPIQKVYWQGSAETFKKGTIDTFKSQTKELINGSTGDIKDTYQQFYDDILKRMNSGDTVDANRHVNVENLNEEKKIGDYLTHTYNVYIDSTLSEKIWISFDLKPFQEIDLKKLMKFTSELSPMENGISTTNSDKYIDLVQKGLVVKTEKYINGYLATTTKLKLVKKGVIPDTFFSPPPLYRKASIKEVLSMDSESDIPTLPDPDK